MDSNSNTSSPQPCHCADHTAPPPTELLAASLNTFEMNK